MLQDDLPKYLSLVNWVKSRLENNELKYGEKLYSENELSAMFNISRQTVRQAVGILEQEGIVERKRGSGTYVIYNGNLSRAPTMIIGIISTYLDSYIFPSIVKGIDKELARNGYSMQLSFTHNRMERERQALRTMLDKKVDGLIVEPTKSALPNHNVDLYHEVKKKEIPLIFFNSYYTNLPFHHVAMDDFKAGKMAANHLIDMGHKKIAGIFQADDRQGHLRYSGYFSALKNAGIAIEDKHVCWFTTEDISYFSDDYHRYQRALEGCTAVVCYNDQIAFSLINESLKRGINIPDDLSVMGIDNSEIASMCEIPISSVTHPMERLGRTVAENILRLIMDDTFDATIDFSPKLIKRSSVKLIN